MLLVLFLLFFWSIALAAPHLYVRPDLSLCDAGDDRLLDKLLFADYRSATSGYCALQAGVSSVFFVRFLFVSATIRGGGRFLACEDLFFPGSSFDI